MLNADMNTPEASGSRNDCLRIPAVDTSASYPPVGSTYGDRAKTEDGAYVQMEDADQQPPLPDHVQSIASSVRVQLLPKITASERTNTRYETPLLISGYDGRRLGRSRRLLDHLFCRPHWRHESWRSLPHHVAPGPRTGR